MGILTQIHVACEVVIAVLVGPEIHFDVLGVVDACEIEPALSRGGRATARRVWSAGAVRNGLDPRPLALVLNYKMSAHNW